MMRSRKHHNNKGSLTIKKQATSKKLKKICKKLGFKFEDK